MYDSLIDRRIRYNMFGQDIAEVVAAKAAADSWLIQMMAEEAAVATQAKACPSWDSPASNDPARHPEWCTGARLVHWCKSDCKYATRFQHARLDPFATSPFALLDAHSCLRLVTDLVHEDDALCLALACRPLRDALWARFPARPAGHEHVGKRLRTRDVVVARLGASVTAYGVLYHPGLHSNDSDDSDGFDESGSEPSSELHALPVGIGRLAYLPRPGLRSLNLRLNENLTGLPEELCALVGLECLDLQGCGGLTALPEGMGALVGLRGLYLNSNTGLTVLPEGLCSLVALTVLNVSECGLTALPEGIRRLVGLRTLNLNSNKGLTALPEELCSLTGLTELSVAHCDLMALPEGIGAMAGLRWLDLDGNRQLAALPAGLCSLVGLEELDIKGCALTALPEGVGGLTGLQALHLSVGDDFWPGLPEGSETYLVICQWYGNTELTALPAGLGRLRNLEELTISKCPRLATLAGLQRREGLPALLAHLRGVPEMELWRRSKFAKSFWPERGFFWLQ
jgi:hypothetical protein